MDRWLRVELDNLRAARDLARVHGLEGARVAITLAANQVATGGCTQDLGVGARAHRRARPRRSPRASDDSRGRGGGGEAGR